MKFKKYIFFYYFFSFKKTLRPKTEFRFRSPDRSSKSAADPKLFLTLKKTTFYEKKILGFFFENRVIIYCPGFRTNVPIFLTQSPDFDWKNYGMFDVIHVVYKLCVCKQIFQNNKYLKVSYIVTWKLEPKYRQVLSGNQIIRVLLCL